MEINRIQLLINKKLAFIICYLLLGQIAISQSIVVDNKIWSQTYGAPTCQCNLYPEYCYSHYLKILKDTIINNNIYKKVWKCNNKENIVWSEIGFLRETDDGKVHYLPINNSNEFLLYDFNCKKNDTLVSIRPTIYKYIVDSIGQTIIGNSIKKKYYLHDINEDFNQEIWIESIGSLKGLLESFMPETTGGCGFLQCVFTNNDSIIFHKEGYDNCFFEAKTNGIENSKEIEINVFPNPTKDGLFFIECPKHNEDFIFQIFTLEGQRVFTKRLSNKEKYSINLSFCHDGVFLYKICNAEMAKIGKIIIN